MNQDYLNGLVEGGYRERESMLTLIDNEIKKHERKGERMEAEVLAKLLRVFETAGHVLRESTTNKRRRENERQERIAEKTKEVAV